MKNMDSRLGSAGSPQVAGMTFLLLLVHSEQILFKTIVQHYTNRG